jgi:hypothetical protein
MRKAHPRSELFASNLTCLCSYRGREDTREAYIYLVTFDTAYRKLTHKAATARYSLQTDPDCEYLRSVLEAKPVTKEEIETCKRSLS